MWGGVVGGGGERIFTGEETTMILQGYNISSWGYRRQMQRHQHEAEMGKPHTCERMCRHVQYKISSYVDIVGAVK